MKVTVTQDTTWNRALNAARKTVGLKPLKKEPSDEWKKMALMAEHSPIKLVEYTISFTDLKQWVGVHLLRHQYVLPFIHSQRVDRRNLDDCVEKVMAIISDDVKNDPSFNKRDYLFQGEPNDQDFVVNAQTLINISRKRLCKTASKETQEAWKAVQGAIREFDPVMASFMVPNCVYRGFCPERESCGLWKSNTFNQQLNEYRNLIGRGE